MGKAVRKASTPSMFSEGDLGVLPPLGVYDPLGLIETRDMRRFEIMEIKHGRAAMLGFLHVIALKAGIVLPGDLSPSLGVSFSDVPTTCLGSLEAVPTFGWLQIMLFTCMQETGASPFAEAQTDDKEAGDIAIDGWVRYDDPETKTFKLNAERQNGRAAMLGITGCLIHELLGVDALYPTCRPAALRPSRPSRPRAGCRSWSSPACRSRAWASRPSRRLRMARRATIRRRRRSSSTLSARTAALRCLASP